MCFTCQARIAALFDKVANKGAVFPDGAKAWDTVANEANKDLRVAPVTHQRQEFVYKDARAKARGGSRLRGTQVLDRRWDGLDSWVGSSLATLVKGRPNPLLWQRVRSFQGRVRQRSVYKSLGNACKH